MSVEVPVDYRANTGPTIKIEYSVSFASGESKGILFYVVGGPGGSGIGVADDYLAAFDARLTENMDIVFFDQRGVGPDHGIECPKAQGAFDMAEIKVEQADGAIAAAKTFATDCAAELKSRDLLGFVDTEVAIRDLEEFRQKIGAPKVWIYGESYGTQFSQQYATHFPTAVKGVVLDGVVDLALDFDGYYASYTEAAEKILARVLAACGDSAACAKDMQGDAAAAYDALAAKLPVEVDFPRGDGTTVKRQLTSAMLEANAFYALYGPDDRATFLRALAATSRGELLPMLRLATRTWRSIRRPRKAWRTRPGSAPPTTPSPAPTMAKARPTARRPHARSSSGPRRLRRVRRACCDPISPSAWPAPSGRSADRTSGRSPMPAASSRP